MLHGEFVIGTRNRAFQEAPDILDAVRMDVPSDIFFCVMVDNFMLRIVVPDPSVGSPIVGDDDLSIMGRVFLDECVQGLPIRSIDDLQSDFPASLNHANGHGFVLKVGPTAFPVPFQFSSDKGFIHLNGPLQWRGVQFGHRCSDTMTEIPGGFIGHTDHSLHLVSRHAFLGFDGQVDGDEPLAERQVSIMPEIGRAHV